MGKGCYIKAAAIGVALAFGLSGTAAYAALNVTPATCTPAPNGSSNTCSVTDGSTTATVTASGPSNPNLTIQNYRGEQGIGVGFSNSSNAATELQAINVEQIDITYTNSQSLVQLVIAHLYNPSEFGGDPQEIARITATSIAGATQVVSLQSLNNTPGGFTLAGTGVGAGTATRVGNGAAGQTGVTQGRFVLSGIFADFMFNKLTFNAICVVGGSQAASCGPGDNSDYSIASVSTVPLPAASLLLLGGLAGLGAISRRRKASA